jgi:hypothetical protein
VLSGDIAPRNKVALQLPSLMDRLVFLPEGPLADGAEDWGQGADDAGPWWLRSHPRRKIG